MSSLFITPSSLAGSVFIPGSKSHTIRAIAIASLGDGVSEIINPLISDDTLSAVNAYRALGATIECNDDCWRVYGFPKTKAGLYGRCTPDVNAPINVGNSGTTLYIAMTTAALGLSDSIFTGDEQLSRRPIGPLVDALNNLGALLTCDNNTLPVHINPCRALHGRSKRKGCFTPSGVREITLDSSKTSQYLSALLINMPTACCSTIIHAENLVEKPYVDMTLNWVKEQGIAIDNDNYETFTIKGGNIYKSFKKSVPADFSSATFFLCASILSSMQSGSSIEVCGLDMSDSQGDKEVIAILEKMGATFKTTQNGIILSAEKLNGVTVDLSDMPDALPAIAVVATFAEGETRIVNVAQARLKETDRIAVMAEELGKMGADITETDDGLIIKKSHLMGATIDSHRDHRIAMSCAVAALFAQGDSIIENSDAIAVTFPTFTTLMCSLGANITEK